MDNKKSLKYTRELKKNIVTNYKLNRKIIKLIGGSNSNFEYKINKSTLSDDKKILINDFYKNNKEWVDKIFINFQYNDAESLKNNLLKMLLKDCNNDLQMNNTINDDVLKVKLNQQKQDIKILLSQLVSVPTAPVSAPTAPVSVPTAPVSVPVSAPTAPVSAPVSVQINNNSISSEITKEQVSELASKLKNSDSDIPPPIPPATAYLDYPTPPPKQKMRHKLKRKLLSSPTISPRNPTI